jgi:alkanesulfonate monooxygenase SsuD/methylene tetrahydromethanopterin reductase-like flavin-dependent oxidoreductase (luciferase family)
MCSAAALATTSLTLGTSVAVAFPRNPMLTAQAAWMLAEATDGRFVVGLGTQVRAHIARRFSAAFAHPGPRLREYLEAMRAIYADALHHVDLGRAAAEAPRPLRQQNRRHRLLLGARTLG